MKFAKIIKGENCYLKQFNSEDKKLTDCIHTLFNDKQITGFLNPDYPLHKNKREVNKWIKNSQNNPVQQWYVIVTSGVYIGYVCFKWREHFTYACEISTAILNEYRGLKLGFESSKILVDYIKSLKFFKFAVAYTSKKNNKAANNLRKIGFRKNSRLFHLIELNFYDTKNVNPHSTDYQLLAIKLF